MEKAKKEKKEGKEGKKEKKEKKEKKDKENTESKDANTAAKTFAAEDKKDTNITAANFAAGDKKEKKDKKDKKEKKEKSEKNTEVPPVISAPPQVAAVPQQSSIPEKKDKVEKKDKKDKKDKKKEDKKDKKEKKDEKASGPPSKKAKKSDDEEAGDFWKSTFGAPDGTMDDFFVSDAQVPKEAANELEEKAESEPEEELDLFPPEEEVFDPLAPRSITLSEKEAQILMADGGMWLQRIHSFAAGAQVEVAIDSENDASEASIKACSSSDESASESAKALERGYLCFKGMLASHQGDFVEVTELPEADADDEHLAVLDLPEAAGATCVQPKKMIEAFEVIAALVQEKGAAPALQKKDTGLVPDFAKALGFSYGQAVEGRYEEQWYHGEIVGFSGENCVVVQWLGGGEDAQAELSPVDVRPSKNKAPLVRELRPGGRLIVFGGVRGRMAAVLQAMAAVERRVPGHFSERNPPAETEALFGFGLKLFQLPATDGGAVARQRSKIAAASEAIVEVLGKYVAIAGESDERCRAEALAVKLVPNAGPAGDASNIPDELTEHCSWVRVPSVAVKNIWGTNRSDLDSIEEDTGTIAFWLPVGTEPRKRSVDGTVDIGAASVEVGSGVNGKYEGQWHPATVLSAGSPGKVRISWEFDGSEAELSFAEVRCSSKAQRERQLWLKNPRVLAIIGPEKHRREAALRVMAASEMACPGLWSSCVGESLSEVRDGADEDEIMCGAEAVPHDGTEAEFEWATTPQGLEALRRAAAAAGCAVEYIKRNAIFVGERRQRGAEYVRWTIKARRQAGVRRSTLSVPDADMREDISIMTVPESRVQLLRPDRLGPIERKTGTIALFDDGGGSALPQGHRRLLICGGEDSSRELASHRIQAMLDAAGPVTAAESPSSGGAEGSRSEEPAAKVPKVEKSNPKEILAKMAWPASINQWGQLQKKIWVGHTPLLKGWIRIWSKSQDKEYYLRTKDMKTTFELSEISED